MLINFYLSIVLEEAQRRGYRFDPEKVDWERCGHCELSINVSRGQVEYEKDHLLAKLKLRDLPKYESLVELPEFEVHPVFRIVEGGVEEWEKRSDFRQ